MPEREDRTPREEIAAQNQRLIKVSLPATRKPPRAAAQESAILATLDPGSYTAVVRGKNNTTGIALVEVYQMP